MNSRFLFQLVFAITVLSVVAPFKTSAADANSRQYYELRVYSTKSEEQQKRVNDYWANAAVPAYNRIGSKPIGVFTEMQDSPSNHIYVVIPFESLEAFNNAQSKLAADSTYQKAAAEFLAASKSDPAYVRFETSLLAAFDGMKQMAVPTNKQEVFELRTYISSSEGKGLSKIKMFNSGEISVMKEVGLSPIFFSQKIAGPDMPSLVYMTSGENPEAHAQHWKAFSAAPVWKALQADPQYKDNVAQSIKLILKRTAASQL